MDTRELLLNIINEASNGKVIIDYEEWPIGFNTKFNDGNIIGNDSNNATLVIRDLDLLVRKIDDYLNLELRINRKSLKGISEDDHKKLLITYLFVNCSTEDFLDFERYIDRFINFINDDTFNDSYQINLDGLLNGNRIVINNCYQSTMMETPKKFEIKIDNNDDDKLEFLLPEISYGISDGCCYIYSILNKENINNSPEDVKKYKKKISRLLYKINNNVMDYESDEFLEYKNGNSDYCPENISDVSVSSVLSLYIFVNMLKGKVNSIKGVPYLPLRYNSRVIAAKGSNKEEELLDRNDNIQYNASDKFIRTFRRVAEHTDFLNIDSYPYENDEFISCSIGHRVDNKIDNEFMEDINRSIR